MTYKNKLLLLFSSFIILYSTQSQAGLIDNGNSIIDDTSNLEWLKLTETTGNSILATESSAFFGPYRWATESEILTLFEYVYGPRVSGDFITRRDAEEWARANEFIRLLGPTGNNYAQGVSKAVELSPNNFGLGYIQTFSGGLGWNSESPSHNCCWDQNDSAQTIGSWLVREAKIPEPTSLFLFVIGLTGLGFARKGLANLN